MTHNSQAFHRAGLSPPNSTGVNGSFSAMMAAQQTAPPQILPTGVASTSPTAHARLRTSSASIASGAPRLLTPFDTGDIRILLLENVSQGAVKMLRDQGYQVDFHPKAWTEDELVEKIGQYHAIGIRSKTKITQKVIRAAHKVSGVHRFEKGAELRFLAS